MTLIRILPDNLVNQIAAGEVVERPASVVKELVENALDAGARSILIDIEGGGRRRIRVSDDGGGMEGDEALLALQRHATSKIAEEDDLHDIRTLGFRGEALPAIASVSRLTLSTSTGGVAGTRIDIEGGAEGRVSETGHPRGTTVDVRDLFYNTPARAKFLRSASTELGHISDIVASLGVTIPAVKVTLDHGSRRLVDTSPTDDVRERLVQLFGDLWLEAIPFDASSRGVRAYGYIAPPARSSAGLRMQRLYVNGRLVRDRIVRHALASACEGFFPKGRHAQVFLFVETPAGTVDVNVHPTKAEVRFRDSRPVHDLVREAIAAALGQAMPVTPFGIEPTVAERTGPLTGQGIHESVLASMQSIPERLAEGSTDSFGRPPTGSSVHKEDHATPTGFFDEPVALAHYRESYIVAADPEGLLLVDQHAAHERILYERLLADVSSAAPESQTLMFPLTFTLPRTLTPLLPDVLESIGRLGFDAESFGDGTLMVRSAPALVEPDRVAALMDDILEELAGEDGTSSPGPAFGREKLIATIACHAAIKVRMPLTVDKMNYLINELFRTANPLKCPHGRPSVLRFSHREIEQGFDRP